MGCSVVPNLSVVPNFVVPNKFAESSPSGILSPSSGSSFSPELLELMEDSNLKPFPPPIQYSLLSKGFFNMELSERLREKHPCDGWGLYPLMSLQTLHSGGHHFFLHFLIAERSKLLL